MKCEIKVVDSLVTALAARVEGGLFRTQSGTLIILPRGAERNSFNHIVAMGLSNLGPFTLNDSALLSPVVGSVTITSGGAS